MRSHLLLLFFFFNDNHFGIIFEEVLSTKQRVIQSDNGDACHDNIERLLKTG